MISGSRENASAPEHGETPRSTSEPIAATTPANTDIFAAIEKLAGLRDKGFISEEEFSAKKADLLKRL